MRRSKEWQKHVTGGLSIIELTWNKKNGYHPHLHLIVDGIFWSQKALSATWLKVTKDSPVVDIRMIYSKKNAASYISKYVSKGIGSLELPSTVTSNIAIALHGVRTLSTFGHLHNIKYKNPSQSLTGQIEHVTSLYQIYADAYNNITRAKRISILLNHIEHQHRNPETDQYSDKTIKIMHHVYKKIMRYIHPPIKLKPKPKNILPYKTNAKPIINAPPNV